MDPEVLSRIENSRSISGTTLSLGHDHITDEYVCPVDVWENIGECMGR